MEILLLSTVWCGEQFTPDIQQNTVRERDVNPPCSSIYSEKTASCRSSPQREVDRLEPVEQLRYIYTPQSREMVIDSYGTFTVREISVERAAEGVTGSPTSGSMRTRTRFRKGNELRGFRTTDKRDKRCAGKPLILMLAAIPALCPLQSCDATEGKRRC